MKKIFTSLAVALVSTTAFAQVITQNNTPNVVESQASVACAANDGSYTSDNYYSRAFKLSDYSINYDYKITNVAFGVESASDTFPVLVSIYKMASGTYPSGTTTLLNAVDVEVSPDNNLGMVDTGTDLEQVIPSGSTFVVEIYHDGQDSGQLFYMGANAQGQTKPSYLMSAGCSVNSPVTTTAIGFPNAQWVMTITGENPLGVTEVINSKVLQIFPNPVQDVLNFRLANGLKAESVELYDMAGKKVKTTESLKSIESVNVGEFAKGTYILKVKANDGKVYIQKVLKK